MTPSSKITSGRIILSIIAVFTTVAPFLADWNASHIGNPLWPPHAKFHNAQTMTMAVLLGLSALFFTWRLGNGRRAALLPSLLFTTMYWITQAVSFLYPGVSWTDLNLLKPGQSLSQFPPQLMLDFLIFNLAAVAAWAIATAMPKSKKIDKPG